MKFGQKDWPDNDQVIINLQIRKMTQCTKFKLNQTYSSEKKQFSECISAPY